MADRGDKLRYIALSLRRPAIPAVLITALVAFFLCTAASGCSSSSPERVVKDFLSARIAGNDERAARYTVEGDISTFMGGESLLFGNEISLTMDTAYVDDDFAVVTVHFNWEERVTDIPYACRRIEDKWKVSLRDTEEMWLGETQ